MDGAVAIPYGEATKFRKGWKPGERKFWWDTGKRDPLFNLREVSRPTVFVCEGESDCMRLWQEVPDHERVGVVAVSGVDGWTDAAATALTGSKVFVVLDNDDDYAVRSQGDAAFARVRSKISGAKRVVLPTGTKDICEFFAGYNFDAFRLLVGETSKSRFKPLNLKGKPPSTQWLAQGLIARGDVHLLFGEPTVGKSWITLDLAVGVSEGRGDWMGFPLLGGSGRVLYVDEENPVDVVLQRLRLLGLSEQGESNLRFLHHPGIRLDKDPHALLEEVKDYEPRLLIIDSLTRVHTKSENDAGEMSALFNDAIIPLAHATNTAVIMIHHAGKSDANPKFHKSSMQRARGSGDIIGASDTAIDIRAGDVDTFNVIIAKSRRVPIGHIANVRRIITSTSAKLEQMSAPF